MREGRGISQEEFACVVDRYQGRLQAFLYGLVGSTESAFDLVQDTFYEAWRSTQHGDAPWIVGVQDSEQRRWLFRAAYNNAITILRRQRLIRWESLDVPDYPEPPVAEGRWTFEEQFAEGEALAAALAQLSPQDTACLLLRIVHGFSAAEVGIMFDASSDAINQRTARAKQRLRAAYIRTQTPTEERTSR